MSEGKPVYLLHNKSKSEGTYKLGGVFYTLLPDESLRTFEKPSSVSTNIVQSMYLTPEVVSKKVIVQRNDDKKKEKE